MPAGSGLARFSLRGLTALVTGAGTGIGQALAVGLAEAGADLVLLAERDNLADTHARVEACGRRAERLVLDLADHAAIPDAVRTLLARRRVDILVNNAGVIRREPATTMSWSAWRDVLAVNLDAAFALSQQVAGPMLERGAGKVINVASLMSFQGGLEVASYAASKHGLAGLTKALANEWGPRGVQVNAIAPGYIASPVSAALRADPGRSAALLARIPAGRWGEPDDLAGAAVFLASSAADYVNGAVLAVDGGWLAR